MAVRVGFLGAGLIARYHASMLARSRAASRVVVVHDPDPARAEAFAAETGATVATSEEAVIGACDAVYVCTWTSEHPRLVEAAAAAGRAVFCEKPLATNLADSLDMVEAVRRAGVTNQVGLVLRDSPAFLLLRYLIRQPESGRVMSVVFRDDQYIPVQGMYGSDWRGDRARAGAGTLLEHSIHDVDLLELLIGPVSTVNGRSAEFHGLDGIEDVVVGTLEFENGAVGSLTSVWHDLLDRPSLRRVEVLCERAWFALEGDHLGPVRWMRPGGDEGVLEGQELVGSLHAHNIRPRNPDGAFIRAVEAGEPATPAFADALRPHVLVEALYRSAGERGAPVVVPRGVPGVDWL